MYLTILFLEDGSARTRPLQWSQLFARDTAPARYIVNAGGNYFDRPMEAANDEMPHLVPEKTMEERLMEMVDNEIEHNANEVGSDLFRREDADTVEQLREFVRSRSEIIQNQGNALREATVMLNNVKKQLVNYESIIHNKSTIIDEMNKQLRVSKQSYTKVWTSLQERAKTINYQRVKIQNLEKALNFANTCGAKKLVVRRMPKSKTSCCFLNIFLLCSKYCSIEHHSLARSSDQTGNCQFSTTGTKRCRIG